MRYKKWRYQVNEYFTFTRRERNGILVLSLVFIVLQLSILILHFLPDPYPLVMDAATVKKLAEFEIELKRKAFKPEKFFYKHFEKRDSLKQQKQEELFSFNPNTLDENGWQRLGFSEKQTAAIVKWRERSGKFHTKEELSKVWVIDEKKFNKISAYISIPLSDKNDTTHVAPKYPKRKEYEKPVLPKVEINTADEAALSTLPMIGEGRAKAIVRYREFLGGFINLDQLKEVRCLPDSVIIAILPRIVIDVRKVKLLNINVLDINALRHPYLPKTQANMIVNYQHEHGNFKTIEELEHLPLFTDELYRKIAPYLTVNPN